jgi:hypothetical protein
MPDHTPLNICDLCTGSTVRWVYLTPTFKIVWDPPAIMSDITYDEGAWGACSSCAKMIDRRDIPGLVQRAIRMVHLRPEPVLFPYTTLERHFTPIFETLLQVKGARRTPEQTRNLQHYADEPIGFTWLDGQTPVLIMPNQPLDQALGLPHDKH